MLRQLQQGSWRIAHGVSNTFARPFIPCVAVSFVSSSGYATNTDNRCRGVYVTDLDNKGQISPILIGLMDYFQRHVPKVGFFQPVAGDPFPHSQTGLPRHVELMKSIFNLPGDPSRMIGVTKREAINLLATGKNDELTDRIFTAYDSYQENYDVVILEGFTDTITSNFAEANAGIATSMNSAVLLVTSVQNNEAASEVFSRVMINKQQFDEEHADLLGIIVNKARPNDLNILTNQLQKKFSRDGSLPFLGVLPQDNVLASVRLDEVLASLNAKLLFGDESALDREFGVIYTASATLELLLEYVEEGDQLNPGVRPLVIASGSRGDVLIGMVASHMSGRGPMCAGVIITGADKINRKVLQVIKGLQLSDQGILPMIATEKRTFDVTTTIASTSDSILPTSQKKIDHAKLLFDRHINMNPLIEKLAAHAEDAVITPKMFTYNIRKRCMQNPQHIILPESLDKRVLAAAAEVTQKKIAKITLLGEPEKILMQANALSLDISACQIIDHMKSPLLEKYIAAVVEARKKRNVSPEAAKDLLLDENYFATSMVLCGDADGMVSGATHTTANTIRPALQILRSKGGLVSSIFFMCLPDKILVYGDCAVNVSPTPEQLAEIATTSAHTAKAFGIEPRVALLSYSTLGSGSGPEVEKVTAATEIAKKSHPELKIEGPIQYDAAVDPDVAAVKIKTPSDVAGQANVCVFPDLNTGNNTYKAVQQSTGAIAIGPLLQGLDKPVNDLSRGCTVADIINTVECTAVQAMQAKGLI